MKIDNSTQTNVIKVTRATQTQRTKNVQIHIQLAPTDDRPAQRLYAVNQVLIWALKQNELDKNRQQLIEEQTKKHKQGTQKNKRRKISTKDIAVQTKTSVLRK